MDKPVSKSGLVRASKLTALGGGYVVRRQRTKLSMLGRSEQVRERLADESVWQLAEQMVQVLGEMKGLAMKLGQLLSLFDLDLVPPRHRETFQRRLAVLFDSAPPVPFDGMRQVIEEDFGASLETLFAEFDPQPIAAASIGQVYRARLEDGVEVAVKVQYPGIDASVRADLRNLAPLRPLLRPLLPAFTVSVFDEMRDNFENEIDYTIEARSQQRVASRYAGHPFIAVPQVFPEHSSRRVLVSEYMPGIGFDAMRALPAAERNRIGEIIYRFYVGTQFEFNEFCGDPHPGNVLLGPDGRVVFVDFGLYKHMSAEHVALEAACLRAIAEDRPEDLYRLMVERGVIGDRSGVTVSECFDFALAATEWSMVDGDVPITPDLACGGFLTVVDPRRNQFSGMRHQSLPPEHLISRRADFWTCATLGHLRATANWYRIACEWLYGDPPVTELGLRHRDWKAQLNG
ncbi:putative unusual protein kinase regulating ubiquinone biosynthesis (AarF/ABC1/UbiB family) [Nocardia sp. GAS34]|uniref:ABC1 kinase family protein n=1 Tax=unclassified Nocardia TaxID=2637762 RepID=UPI003D1F7EA5